MEIDLKTGVFLATQVIMVTSVIVTNRANVRRLEQTTQELKQWLIKIQDTVNNLRVKVGI